MANDKDTDYKYPTERVGGNEIISLCIGNCGISIGNEYYQRLLNEHKIDENGNFFGNRKDRLLIDRSNTYFKSSDDNNKYIPRAIFCDMDCSSVDRMRASWFGSLLTTDSFISSNKCLGSMTWAHGHYTDGAECIDEFEEKIRNSIEICDYLSGFEMMHGISGGVGGGFASLLLMKLRDTYPDKRIFTYSVYPSRTFYEERNTNIVSYNTLLSMHQFIENADLCFILDNGSVFSLLKNEIGCNTSILMNDINWLQSLVLSGVSSTFRFDCEPHLHCNLESMYNYFVSFPRLHFASLNVSPVILARINEYKMNIDKVLNELLVNDCTDIKAKDGKILNIALHYRADDINDMNAINKMSRFIKDQECKLQNDFVQWIPSNIQSCVVYDGDNFCYKQNSAIITTAIYHTTAIKSVFQRIVTRFTKVFKRRAYLHWYKGEGMDEMEFIEANKNIRDLIIEYQDKQDIVIEDDNDDGRVTIDNDQNEQKYTANDNDDDF